MTTAVRYARWYARHGLHVFLLPARSKEPRKGSHAKDDATIDLPTINRWFDETNGGTPNIGIACEPSQIVVIDEDTPREKNGWTDGRIVVAEIEKELGPLPPTWTNDTPSGGVHRAFRAPVGVELVGKLGKGCDVIRNGYIVAPPSIHPSGHPYRWRAGHAPGEIAIAELPPSWIDRLRVPEPAARPARPGTAIGADFYAALESLDQRYVLGCISGSSLVGGEVITFVRAPRGRYKIYIDGHSTSNFIDGHGKIGAPRSAGGQRDGGPLASSWCRFYGHSDAAIRAALVELVPELARFRIGAQRRTLREPPRWL